MEEENFIIRMVDIMMESGRKIKCMVGENCTTREASWHMKENGLMISFMATGKSIMTIRSYLMEVSIIQTSIC